MHPGDDGEGALPSWKAIDGRTIDTILINHDHQDHIGTLPVLMRRQPNAPVFMTEETGQIGAALLHNSVNVMTREREELGTVLYPLFTHRETERASDRWHFCRYRQGYSTNPDPDSHDGDLAFEFWDGGHVLGSSGILLRVEGRTIFYTGDVNFDDQTIMSAAVFPEGKIDILIIECTRGDHAQSDDWTRAGEERRLAVASDDPFKLGRCVLIPVFALGKTQEVLAMLYQF